MAKGETYEEFIEKFKPKKTTDDCYTPPAVYEVIADYVSKTYGIDREHFVRPFWPGGDYEHYPYKPDDVVVDNPPFSIMSGIVRFYLEHGIRFFLFISDRSAFWHINDEVTLLFAGKSIVYDNGADVGTVFITNLENEYAARTVPELGAAIAAVNQKTTKTLPKYKYPPNIIQFVHLKAYAERGIEFKIPRAEARVVRRLDSQKEQGKTIFGGGLLLSKRLAAERLAADRLAAERLAEKEKIEWTLSPSEMEIVEELSK